MNTIIRRLFLGLIAVLSGLIAIGAGFFAMNSLQQQKGQDEENSPSQVILESPTPEILNTPTPAIPNTTEPDPVTSDAVYTNTDYGIQFTYPAAWDLTEQDYGVNLEKDSIQLIIRYKFKDEDVLYFRPTGTSAGNFIYLGKIHCLGMTIPLEGLSYEGKVKTVYYGVTGYVSTNNLDLLFILEDANLDYLQANLTDEVIAEASKIIESFQVSS